jgi:hypothetical protein
MACTSTKRLTVGDLTSDGDVRGTYHFSLKDGQVLTTDRVELGDSVLVFREVIVDGRRTSIAPMSVRFEEILLIEKTATNVSATLAICGIGAAIIVISVALMREISDELGE